VTVILSPPPGKGTLNLPADNVGTSQWKTGQPAGRLGDRSQAAPHPHGCPGCPHPSVGPAILGSPNVFINNLPALRVGDPGIAAACCGSNTWRAHIGTPSVIINGLHAHRKNDATLHCGGFPGQLIEGSPDVFFPSDGRIETPALLRPLRRV
jgi:uncharacterized Zn-binding protein involved in type VI secretion